MKTISSLCLSFMFTLTTFSQERFLSVASKDSINNRPKFTTSLGVNMKLNGYYDIFGGLNDNDTFNVGHINVFGNDDSNSLNVDMYQTQINWTSEFVLENGKVIKAVVESDFWGGNGRVRLRKAYIESEHWQIGQTWNNFGDADLWPNIMEWEGPPSGVWLRNPHIKYMNSFKNPNWIYEISIEAPMTDYTRFDDLEPLVEKANQTTPDLTFAVSYKKDWGHIRAVSLLRNVRYKLEGETDNFIGYGFGLSGIYKVSKNNFQFQITGGKGITSYLTTISGSGYDGYPTNSHSMNATPSFGGWMAYEYFFSKKWHSNLVVGSTYFQLKDLERYILTGEELLPEVYLNGNVEHRHYYLLFNTMYDLMDRLTLGIELDYGVKNLKASGTLHEVFVDDSLSRDAMRISFGFMFYF
ncbi:DcaP family trimeric outer membrane transporter [Xanthomarina sp. F1114]|uniref:DcaP family trimeric outer membrane transporter n=1 Tax=Xanthomarina sp. F1114 TaxID=2996019 RepID=UPI00225DD56D|nr:DcaP family trimeric outer membrane transporter [Xanthomarina sp. F1114]MCX7549126.1 DcaP family trimeric outer membrane transporter [Xanthomarina sp. F1114]